MRDHGGDLDRARARYGDGGWLDLSTGINPTAYPVGDVPDTAWTRLPDAGAIEALERAAQAAYGTQAPLVALAGAQAAIQLVPRLAAPGRARILGPTYNEHTGALREMGWDVSEVRDLADLHGAELAVVVNPNNPDGLCFAPDALHAVAREVGTLVVDESFTDATPDLSLASSLSQHSAGLIVLRSFGKFYGLAGLRLGFMISGQRVVDKARALAGPWAVSGLAVEVGQRALRDTAWRDAMRAQLAADAAQLDALALRAGWAIVGGTPLFRTYETGDALAAQDQLAQGRVWSRIFPYSVGWIRLGLPGSKPAWEQLEAALSG